MSLSTPAWSETMDDLVQKNDLFYNKFTEQHPFSGKVTGKSQGTIKDGKKEGLWVTYHNNGQLASKGEYNKNGKREGSWVHYNEDGTVDDEYTGTFKNGEKISSD